MNTTRTGKIARLPQPVREELNHRMENGESGTSLCAWLHAQPEVQSVLSREFGRRPINAQNLTEWRQGGFRDWQAAREARSLARDLGQEMLNEPESETEVSAETLVLWLAGRYAVATRRVEDAANPKEHWKLLRQMCSDVLRLRQGDITLKRLEVQGTWQKLRCKPAPEMAASVAAQAGMQSGRPAIPQPPQASPKVGSPQQNGGGIARPKSDPTASTGISPTEIPLGATRVFQANSNQFKPFKNSGSPRVPLAGPIGQILR